jgi:hypothetical protein
MYSLNVTWYPNQFSTIDQLLYSIIDSGMDPNYEITKDGVPTGETAWDLIGPCA